ncbi:MAG: 2Fe-2S iron-sulfur cluster binding domain-containing protein, partial [Anaerolineales bacterium]|nr:2Fe-2S iron-sulfur cluster binding domain-containing protein [Anaerolineales bacterium]
NAAVVLHFDGDVISQAAIALGSVAPVIVRAPQAEAFLLGKTLSQEVIQEAALLAIAAAQPIDDIRSTAVYRQRMVGVAVARVLDDLAAEPQPQRVPPQPVLLATPASLSQPQSSADGTITTTINGQACTLENGQEKSLLRLLREDALLIGTKEGCAEGECGACTIFLDGKAVMSCLVPAPRAHGARITTIEGLAQGEELHPVQQAFIDNAAVQCGYCTPGFVMSAAKLLEERPQPSREEAQVAVTGNLCRCTGYYKILDAIQQAAENGAQA